jgi:hypothetical protein
MADRQGRGIGGMRGAMGCSPGVGALAVLLTSLSACAASGGGTAGERPRGIERATVSQAPPGDPELGSEPGVESLLRLTRNRMGPLQACYEEGLRKAPAMAGKVVLHFAIRPDGLPPTRTVTWTRRPRQNGCTTSPERSFGSN